MQLKYIVEAMLMSANEPLTLERMQSAFTDIDKPSQQELTRILNELAEEYTPRAIELIRVASGYRIQTKTSCAPWLSQLANEKPAKYSAALLETLAIIAYQQPVTRGDIEEIRGVTVNSGILKTLLERDWIRILGQRDVPGKPVVYGTTKYFLDYFNLTSLKDLQTVHDEP